MKKNLTISVDREISTLSKKYPKEKGKSLSFIVEDYLKNLVDNRKDEENYSLKLKKLIGAVKLPLNFNEEAERNIYHKSRNY